MKRTLLISAALLYATAPAVAQTQDAPAEAPAAAETGEAPATVSPEAPAASFSDTEVQAFVKSLDDVQRIDQDTTLAQDAKQASMVKAIEAAGLTPQKFNEISIASQSDVGLQQRIQDAFAKTATPQASEAQAADPQAADTQTTEAHTSAEQPSAQ